MIRRVWLSAGVVVAALSCAFAGPRFEITYSKDASDGPLDGRIILIIAKSEVREPRFQVNPSTATAQIFGIDVDGWKPGKVAMIDEAATGHPYFSLNDLPEGTYHVQAVLNVYETFHRADGHTVSLPADNGEGQQWARSPGNLYSQPRQVEIDRKSRVSIELTEVIPAIEKPEDTKYMRRFRMRSELLTRFWGKPVEISAIVLVPEGFDDKPEARYPVLYLQTHFHSELPFFREEPPPKNKKMSQRLRLRAESAYELYQHWVAGRLPKMLIVLTQHATPVL